MGFKDYLKSDLDTFLNVDEFAEEVKYHFKGTTTEVVVQFFDEESDLGDSMFRKIIVKVDDMPTMSNEGYFLIDNVQYGIISFYKDSQGLLYQILTQEGTK